MEIEEPIGGRSEGGTHLTGLQDVLVSLQKQDRSQAWSGFAVLHAESPPAVEP